MTRPLDGLLVVSMDQAVAAPYCASRLADAGARVIKLERPGGDFARGYDRHVKGISAYFVWLNRGKESVEIDLKQADDKALFERMLAKADVFIQNLSPGAMGRLGFGSEELRARHPRLITVDISGYGDDGPYASMKAYDLLVQAESGLASITGGPNEMGRVGVSVCDVAAGMYAYTAILEALIQRGRTGKGAGIKVSLFDGMADWMSVPFLQFAHAGLEVKRYGLHHATIAPYGAYRCGDGSLILIAVQNEREWQRLCATLLGQPELATRPEFVDQTARVANRAALDREIDKVLSGLTREEVVARLEKADIAYGRVNTVADLARHPQLRLIPIETEVGTVETVAPPARIAGWERHIGKVPALGEHTEKVRREFAG